METSRGVLTERDMYMVLFSSVSPETLTGFGECAPLPGLSVDNLSKLPQKLQEVCALLNSGVEVSDLDLVQWPAIRFAVEAARLDLERGGKRLLFDTEFTRGEQAIPINGLIVMADFDSMLNQVFEKIKQGFDCIKIKVGALDFDAECELLKEIRKRVSPAQIQLRLDANGAFGPETALDKLVRLSEFEIHSLEQPIKTGQWETMAKICAESPIAIALDEELIGVHSRTKKRELLNTIKPHYIILKPTLVGGLKAAEDWIALASQLNIDYWVTSALESNIGLNIISQWTSTLPIGMHQGLGTGQLFVENFPSPLRIREGSLTYSASHTVNPLTDLKLV
ncbi:o-succinylbenzoate synthase [candidate division KSB1 bacterium]|nr:o-succinylbenzoate synthase [candidate division KSB1 bacterium]NIR69451.1 o-succinylbenzoate synthase [candidate division KSB1 bacterium]NIS22800.1 o-succinylbenzoate synthase [candidate division KSB1 bacterium]NIT69640.1 o-succinylbenzoate synthase [candidate division KSB1 bacterium]NIU23309.1 o-succinylbenzoate synthase [candidate division KSB1 bacterium]